HGCRRTGGQYRHGKPGGVLSAQRPPLVPGYGGVPSGCRHGHVPFYRVAPPTTCSRPGQQGLSLLSYSCFPFPRTISWKTSQPRAMQMPADQMGRRTSRVVMKPAMMGGRAMATDCTDWRMPRIVPCSVAPACMEIKAVIFGV